MSSPSIVKASELFTSAFAHQITGDMDNARLLYEAELSQNPLNVSAMDNLAVLCIQQKKYEAAVALASRASSLAPDVRSRANAFSNLGAALRFLYSFDDALVLHRECVRLVPDNANFHHHLALTLMARREYAEALAEFDEAIRLNPDASDYHSDRPFAALHLDDFAAAMRSHESRWLRMKKDHWSWSSGIPQWRGEDLFGKIILVHHEQGFGDSLMFSRYLKALQHLGAEIVYDVPPHLVRLMRISFPDIIITSWNSPGARADYHCPLQDVFAYLPNVGWDTIPSAPYLNAPANGPKLCRIADEKLIGLVWRSGNYGTDVARDKTIGLAPLLCLGRIPNARIVSLQMPDATVDIEAAGAAALVEDTSAMIRDFADTAALISQVNLVVTVDTSVAHLAGAMGKPVFILLPWNCCWRWRDDGAASTWYPSAQLFRQHQPGNWGQAIYDVTVAAMKFMRGDAS